MNKRTLFTIGGSLFGVCGLVCIFLAILSAFAPARVAPTPAAGAPAAAQAMTVTLSPTVTNIPETPATVAPSPLSTLTATLARLFTSTPASQVQGTVTGAANIRSGPGLTYATVAGLAKGAQVTIVGKDPSGQWWKLDRGWVFAALIQVQADTAHIPVMTPLAPTATDTCTSTPRPANTLFPTFTPRPTAGQPVPTNPPARTCCKICTSGCACGNSCISCSKTCHQPPGCACNG